MFKPENRAKEVRFPKTKKAKVVVTAALSILRPISAAVE